MIVKLTKIVNSIPYTVAVTLLSLFLFFIGGCANSVEEVSKLPPNVEKPPSMVSAPLNDALKEAKSKNLVLRAKLILDNTDEYDMDINNGVATWRKTDLPTQSPYDVKVRFELEFGVDSGKYVLVAQAVASHDFSVEPTKTFQVGELSSEYDDDGDKMSNLLEMLAGGNPFNEAPTFTSAAQITVLELSTQILTVKAIWPRVASIKYSIALNDNNLFAINSGPGGGSGLLSFSNPIVFDKNINNQYSVTVRADDGSFTTEQTIVVTVTDVFDLKVNIGLKQLQFSWTAAPNASYYKIVQSIYGSTYKELPASGTIDSLSYTHAFAVHRFEPNNTQFMLRAYDSSNAKIKQSGAI